MAIKQLSVFVENKPGMLYDIFKKMSDAGINMRAMSVADTKDFGVLRLIVSDNAKAKEAFGEDTIVADTDVIAVEMGDTAGALCKVIESLGKNGINIEYAYAFTASKEIGAYTVLRVDHVPEAEMILKDKGFALLDQKDIDRL